MRQCLIFCHIYLFVNPAPEDGQQVDGTDRRGEVARDLLDVDKQLTTLRRGYYRYPRYANPHQNQHANPEGKKNETTLLNTYHTSTCVYVLHKVELYFKQKSTLCCIKMT